MKLWYSFTKELKLASTSFYFGMEIFIAIFFLFILLFVVPAEFSTKSTEYVHLDLPEAYEEFFIDAIIDADLDGKTEEVEFEIDDKIITTTLYVSEDKKVHIVEDKADMILLAEEEKHLGATMKLDEEGQMSYEYYLQGYEAERLKNLYLVVHNRDMETLTDTIDSQDIRPMYTDYEGLGDRESIVPAFLTYNGSLMGLFIIAAYVFLDKKEGIISAYAVTAASVWHYLLSKIGVLIVTTVITSLIITIPVMGLQPNYLMLIVLLTTSGFFASVLGLIVASYYENIMQAFGAIYILIIVMMLPTIAYFIPGWEPFWIKLLPAHYIVNGFKEVILKNGDMSSVLIYSLGFLVSGVVLFFFANYRYKKTLRL